jgi:hypothetical protein
MQNKQAAKTRNVKKPISKEDPCLDCGNEGVGYSDCADCRREKDETPSKWKPIALCSCLGVY